MLKQIIKDITVCRLNGRVSLLSCCNPIRINESRLIDDEAPNGIPNNLMPYITKIVA